VPLYVIECVLLFWVPGVALFIALWPGLRRADRLAFGRTLLLMTPLTLLMEFVYLKADIWNFSEAQDPLLGLTLFGAPIEEFAFWFGATPFVLGVYLAAQRWLPFGWLIRPPRPERRPVSVPRIRRAGARHPSRSRPSRKGRNASTRAQSGRRGGG
jgi:lycopene cyclase domain-containing protein